MTLALLLTAVTGAWATEFTSLKVGDVLHVGDVINTSTNYTVCEAYLDAGIQPATVVRANISTDDITESETGAYYLIKGNNDFYYGVIIDDGYEGGYWPVTDTSDGIVVTAITPGNYTDLTFAVHEGSAEAPITVDWTASTKTGTFSMPGSDVVLTPIYAKAAAFATTGTEPEVKTLLPEAAEGVIAGTDAPLIAEGTGIVAFAGTSTEATQGTLMYAIGNSATQAPALTAFSATVPTAKTVADDGADVLVWYYIQGADAPDGVAATLDNTFSDTEPACLTVTVLTNKFDIQFNAANANTIQAGKATVTVDGTAATVTDGKLQGVKMGSEVKLKAKPGYKFRKVEVKKKEATPLDNTTTAWKAGTFAVPAGGLTYSDGITVSGDVTLVLTDGQTLTLNKGISLASGATLTIQGNGTMNVNGTNESTASTVAGTGTLVLTSGTLTVKGGNGGSVGEYEDEVTKSAGGIAINGAVTVSGGTLTATGGNGGAGGSGQDSRAGAGAAAISGDVTVSGGTLTATGGNGGSFSGDTLGPDGYAGAGGTAIVGSVTITDGTVTATGGNGGSFTISNYGYALYAGNGGAAIGGNATLTGGTLNQTNGTNGTLGGSGTKEECSAGTGGKAVAGTVTDNR